MDTPQQENLHDTAALRALAQGEVMAADLTDCHEDSPGDCPEHIDLDNVSHAEPARGQVSRKVRSAKFTGKQAHSAAMQFRKTAIPLLYVMGVMLWVVAGITLAVVAKFEPSRLEGNPLLENGTAFSIISILLGCCLIAGGVFFHFEVKKTEGNRENSGFRNPNDEKNNQGPNTQ